jgi:hypothetical protein
LKFARGRRFLSFVRWGLIIFLLWMNDAPIKVFLYPGVWWAFKQLNPFWLSPHLTIETILVTLDLLIQPFLGVLALFCAVSEIFDWPRLKREGKSPVIPFFYPRQI